MDLSERFAAPGRLHVLIHNLRRLLCLGGASAARQN
jgi:hypothetical protein